MLALLLASLLAVLQVQDPDADQDGLSDFQEVHKYFTDPARTDSDADGIHDGDWDERREFAYTVRTIVQVLPPVTDDVLRDDYQDARVLERNPGWVELEVIHYPLNTVADGIAADPRWRETAAAMRRWTDPGPTANWDGPMRRDLLSALQESGIDAALLDDKTLVERASPWLLSRARYVDGFTTFCSWFPQGKAAVFPGLEEAVSRGIADKTLTVEDQWQRELFAQGMFEHRVRGSCTSSAIYLNGCLRALGLPTRIVLGIPCVDASDPREIEMVRRGIGHKGVRRILLEALEGQSGAWVSHTLNEVYIGGAGGGRWRRLNYERLGQNVLDPEYLGLMTHIATFSDWSDGEVARTWGVRQAKGSPHDDVFGGPNPYSAISVSDRFGVHARIENELLLGPDEIGTLTIEKAYWWTSSERRVDMDLRGDDPAGHVLLHVREGKPGRGSRQYRSFWSACSREFVLQAPGKPDVPARATRGYWAEPEKSIQEFHLAIEPGDLSRMEAGLPYRLVPVQRSEDFRWQLAGDVTLTKAEPEPVDPSREKTLLLDRAAWSADLERQMGRPVLLAHVGEGQPFPVLKTFTQNADRCFFLEAEGQRTLSLSTGVGGCGDEEAFVMFSFGTSEWNELRPGVEYRLRPRNNRPGWRWRVAEDLRVRRR